ncbi:MAG: hypothetical protein Q9183_004650, partial [Haloplaca sp. 2 TL-2023]
AMPVLELFMQHGDPKHLNDMLKFCYTRIYPIHTPSKKDLAGLDKAIKKHIAMYDVATEYGASALQNLALHAFKADISADRSADPSEDLPDRTVLVLDAVGPVYAMLQPEAFIEVLMEEIIHRHDKLLLPRFEAHAPFLDLMANIPEFEQDVKMRFFEDGLPAFCTGCGIEWPYRNCTWPAIP